MNICAAVDASFQVRASLFYSLLIATLMFQMDVTILSSVITTVAVTVGLMIAILQLRDLKKVREGEVILQASQTFANEFMESYQLLLRLEFKDYDDFQQRYAGKPEELAFMRTATFFEGIGVLVKRGIIPLALADDFFHGVTRVTWLKTELLVRGHRERTRHPEFVEWFEYLYNQTKNYRMHSGESQDAASWPAASGA